MVDEIATCHSGRADECVLNAYKKVYPEKDQELLTDAVRAEKKSELSTLFLRISDGGLAMTTYSTPGALYLIYRPYTHSSGRRMEAKSEFFSQAFWSEQALYAPNTNELGYFRTLVNPLEDKDVVIAISRGIHDNASLWEGTMNYQVCLEDNVELNTKMVKNFSAVAQCITKHAYKNSRREKNTIVNRTGGSLDSGQGGDGIEEKPAKYWAGSEQGMAVIVA